MYDSVSNSRVNWNKTGGLALGGLNVQQCQQIKAGNSSIDRIKVLCVYLGNETFIKTNWVQLENNVHSIIKKCLTIQKACRIRDNIIF